MRRWSREPRRMSVVEGRAAESLARALRIVSCFIYNDETIKRRFCQSLPEHLFQICFGVRQAWAALSEVVPFRHLAIAVATGAPGRARGFAARGGISHILRLNGKTAHRARKSGRHCRELRPGFRKPTASWPAAPLVGKAVKPLPNNDLRV